MITIAKKHDGLLNRNCNPYNHNTNNNYCDMYCTYKTFPSLNGANLIERFCSTARRLDFITEPPLCDWWQKWLTSIDKNIMARWR